MPEQVRIQVGKEGNYCIIYAEDAHGHHATVTLKKEMAKNLFEHVLREIDNPSEIIPEVSGEAMKVLQ